MPDPSIRYLRRGDIDAARWDHCIDTAPNGLIYAYSFYLDHMASNWDALVLGEYEAVMPLTWRKKFGFYYLYQPAFTAALGVFGKMVTREIVQQMLAAIPPKFRLIEIELNAGNKFDLNKQQMVFHDRTNYVLGMNKPYEELFAAYNENLQRNLKKATGAGLRYAEGINGRDVIDLARRNLLPITGYTIEDFSNFESLYTHLLAQNNALAFGVYEAPGELAASAIFFFYRKRAYYIFPGNDPVKRLTGASPYLIDRFIFSCNKKFDLLDFEGSDIPGVARFYAGFGAQPELYYSARLNRLPRLVNWLRSKI